MSSRRDGRRQANHETWCRNVDLFQNDSTVSHGGAPGPCQHRVQKPKRAGAGGRGKGTQDSGRRDEVTTDFRSQSYPRVPRPYSQDRDSAPSRATPHPASSPRGTAVDHAWPPPTRERGGEHPSDGPARHARQSNTSKKKKKKQKKVHLLVDGGVQVVIRVLEILLQQRPRPMVSAGRGQRQIGSKGRGYRAEREEKKQRSATGREGDQAIPAAHSPLSHS